MAASSSVGRSHSWEDVGYSDSSMDEDPERNPEAAATLFLDELVGLYLESRISAQHLCTLCWWARKAGMVGSLVEEYAVRPGQSGGNYQRHLDRVMGFDAVQNQMYPVACPVHPRGQAFGRKVEDIPFRPPHELLHDELVEDGSVLLKLQEQIDSGALPPANDAHPVVREADVPVVPLAVYMDGVAYSQTDSVVGVWLVNLVSNARHMVGLVRKSITCACGCRGWCTFFPILEFLRWSLWALAMGVFPAAGPGDRPFPASDDRRRDLAGRPLRAKAAVLYCKGDWVEFCGRFGFPGHASKNRP
eukprot:9222059-Alexandrium_andersonii.AAC.1